MCIQIIKYCAVFLPDFYLCDFVLPRNVDTNLSAYRAIRSIAMHKRKMMLQMLDHTFSVETLKFPTKLEVAKLISARFGQNTVSTRKESN